MTSPSPLDRLAGPGNVLAKEPPDAKEFAGLVRSGLARLKDAENDDNSLDSRFDPPYRSGIRRPHPQLRHEAIPGRYGHSSDLLPRPPSEAALKWRGYRRRA